MKWEPIALEVPKKKGVIVGPPMDSGEGEDGAVSSKNSCKVGSIVILAELAGCQKHQLAPAQLLHWLGRKALLHIFQVIFGFLSNHY